MRPPNLSNAAQRTIVNGLVEIITGEGPAVTDRLYELYVRASGGQQVENIRHALDQATTTAIRKGLPCQIGDGQTSQSQGSCTSPARHRVTLRRGDRELEHIPPTEVAAVTRHILSQDPSDSELKRLLLSAYERVRLTSNA